jgi:CRISPR-associated protein Cas6
MLWEDSNKKKGFEVDDSVVDLLFNIECRELPVDHIYHLSRAIKDALPGHVTEDLGIHPIYLAGSQNGWERPDESLGQNLILSKRTKLVLRVKKEHQEEITNLLNGKSLHINGFEMKIKKPKTRKLSKDGTVFSRSIVCSENEKENEEAFLKRIQIELSEMGIDIKKALCGKINPIKTPDGPIFTRSLMLAELKPEDAVKLQQQGVGTYQDLGCGLFLPHKGIDAVGESTDDE